MKAGRLWLLVMGFAVAGQPALAAPIDFNIEFTDSTYQVNGGDTFLDLLAQHNAATMVSSNSVTAIEGINTSLYAGGISGDYSVLMTATLDIELAGSYEFQVGADWGRGGGVALFDTQSNTLLHETVDSSDIWWANNWNHPDVISTTYNLSQSEYTIMWLGFEGCCAGSSTVRFAFNGGTFNGLDTTNITPHVVPLPAALYLFVSSIIGLAAVRRGVSRSHPSASAQS